MMPKDKKKFDEWYYSEQEPYTSENLVYDLQSEMLDYSKQDVHILMQGTEKFHQLLINETELDVFIATPTISSACNRIYRGSYMEKIRSLISANMVYSQRNSSLKKRYTG